MGRPDNKIAPSPSPGPSKTTAPASFSHAPSPLIRLAVLISGSGTTLQNLVDQIGKKKLNAQISVVIASRPGMGGIDRAQKAGLETIVIDRKSCTDPSGFSRQVFAACDAAHVDLVCLGGWLCLLELPARYAGRVMNIHPALLPSFGGHGMYGQKVHEAVISHGCKVSGCTVHFLDSTYDTGPIIIQRICQVLDDDTPQSLAHRVFEEEKIAYPQAINWYAQGRLVLEGRRVRLGAAPTS